MCKDCDEKIAQARAYVALVRSETPPPCVVCKKPRGEYVASCLTFTNDPFDQGEVFESFAASWLCPVCFTFVKTGVEEGFKRGAGFDLLQKRVFEVSGRLITRVEVRWKSLAEERARIQQIINGPLSTSRRGPVGF